MNDRFKFRAFDTFSEKMIQNPISMCDGEMYEHFPDGYSTKHDIGESAIVMQCIGLKDKNGVLIYENDIVYKKGSKDYKGNKLYSQIIWDGMYSRFVLSDENGIHNIPTNNANIEVLGNIYENPELLEKTK